MLRRRFLSLSSAATVGLIASNPSAMSLSPVDQRGDLLTWMDGRAEYFGQISRRIWEFAEVGYKEIKSSELLATELRNAGFSVKTKIADIPTAFVAEAGAGKPVIGILGEYDALPGLSQVDRAEKAAITAGAPGHGCGHNLFGSASAFAAIAIKEYLAKSNQ